MDNIRNNKIMGKSKRAIFFTLDALIAAGILLVGLAIISSTHINRQPTVHLSYLSDDLMGVLSELKIYEMSNSYVDELIANGNITNINNSIIEQIGEFWAENKTEIAENFTKAILGGSIPETYGYSILVDDEPVHTRPTGLNYSMISSRKIVSGYAKLKPILGYTAKTFLTGIKNRKSSSFAYFGGFEGQGEMTKKIFLPQNITNITEAYLEVDAGEDFDFYINGNYVGNFIKGSGNGSYKIPDKWVLSESAHSYLVSGENNLTLEFPTGNIMDHYIAGGFFRVTYITPDTEELEVTYNPGGTATKRFWFPAVSGIVNLYSSFDVPGTLTSMSLHLHVLSNYTTFVTIGNRFIELSNGSITDEIIDVGNDNFTAPPAPLDYEKMSNSTVPLRLASYRLLVENRTAANVDLIIITDMSGSMKKSISDNSLGNLGANCAEVYNDSAVRRSQLAKCLDKEMIGDVMQFIGARIWLIQLFNTDDIENWTRDTASELYDVIDTDFDPNGKGKTCISCSVNEAYDIFDAYSSPERYKVLVLMTDGIPTHTSIGNTSEAEQEICVGYCDTTGACGPDDLEGCDDDNCRDAVDDTEFSLQRLRDDLDVDIYGVGFGPISNCTIGNETLRDMIEPPNGTYYSSNDPSALKQIYDNITLKIIEKMTQENQTLGIIGDITESVLYADSYLEINYTPIVSPPAYGEVPVTGYGNVFGNNISDGVLYIPEGTILTELMATSYSDILWTDNVTVSNSNGSFNVFGLYDSSLNYTRLGDPFIVQIPPDKINIGLNNTITVKTSNSPANTSGGSPANRLIYTVRIESLLDYGSVFFVSEGCEWLVEFEDGTNDSISVPANYTGANKCYYANATYNNEDALDDAVYRLFSRLDFDSDGELEIKLDENNLAIDTFAISDVPSLWGPAIVEVRVW